MSSKFLNLSTDNTLGGNSPSDNKAVSEKAIKEYVDNNAGQTYVAGTGLDLTNNEISIVQEDSEPFIVGTLTENDGVYSGFSANDYLQLPPLTINPEDSYEFQFKFTLSNATQQSFLYGDAVLTPIYYNLCVGYVGGGPFKGFVVPDGVQSIGIYDTSYTFSATTYWVRITRTVSSGSYSTTANISTDGTTWAQFGSTDTKSGTQPVTTFNLTLGAAPGYGGLQGSIDTKGCYIKKNEVYWWNPLSTTIVAKATDTLYGLVKPDGTSITINNGVISGNVGTVTSVNNVQPVNGNVTLDIPTNFVTTDTAQDISGKKTFLGEKAILFKQNENTNKLGFTLYNPSSTELGAFEWRPSTIGGGALLNINVPYASSNYVGFRYWGTAVNIIAPKVATAGNYYIPTHFTDGTNTVSANSSGVVSLSTLLPAEVTESTVSGWGFTKNTGTVTSVNNIQPVNGNVTLTIPVVEEYTASEVETLWESL